MPNNVLHVEQPAGLRSFLRKKIDTVLNTFIDEHVCGKSPVYVAQEKELQQTNVTSTTTPKSPKPGSASPLSVAHEEPVAQPSAADPSEPPKSSAVPRSDQPQPQQANQSINTAEIVGFQPPLLGSSPPPPGAELDQLSILQLKVDGNHSLLSAKVSDINQRLSEFDVKTDRILYDMDQ